MCGILGYIGNENSSDIILNGLKKLEYRGYDSWGIAVADDRNVEVQKEVGCINQIKKFDLPAGKVGIGHTRWATHGKVSRENAHPHSSMHGEIIVVHNGIVENYQSLKKFLESKGYKLLTDTDTEIIPNLIEYHLNEKSLFDAVRASLDMIKGSYALLILHKGEHKIIAARKGSPLVLGAGKNFNFAASDIPAFLDRTKNVVYLHDYDLVEFDESNIKIFNLKSKCYVTRKIDSVDWDIEQAKLGKFRHFMLKEISEQTHTIQTAVNQKQVEFETAADIIRGADNIIIIACGSSHHAALSAKYHFAEVAGLKCDVMLASEMIYFKKFIVPDTAIIAISQSGETADILDALNIGKKRGAKIIAVTNSKNSSITRLSEHTILLNAGPEIGVLSTKTYTSQLAILSLLSYTLDGGFEGGQKALRELVRHIYYLTSATMRNRLQDISERLCKSQDIFLIGRGSQYPTALEAALKIKEVSYIHAEGFAGGELKHGSIALIKKGTPCIVFTSKENNQQILSNASELKSRGAYIIGISEKDNEIFDYFIKVIDAGELNSICQIIPIQILAYQLAVIKGLNPDRPRNLAKSVTVK